MVRYAWGGEKLMGSPIDELTEPMRRLATHATVAFVAQLIVISWLPTEAQWTH